MILPAELVVATRNPGKLREMEAGLRRFAGPGLRVRSLGEFPGAPDVEETGRTYVENARLKAESAFRATGLPSLGDDTGLEVDALDGAPGLHSGRWAGADQDPGRNMAKLLAALDGIPAERRTARFRCVLVLVTESSDPGAAPAAADPEIAVVEGVVEGSILSAPRGGSGFGYDPLFLVRGTGKTMAELSLEEKNSLSHRGLALRTLCRHGRS